MLRQFKIDKPRISTLDEMSFAKRLKETNESLMEAVYAVNEPIYCSWNKAQYNTKIPKNIAPVEFWYFVKQVRKYASRKTSIKAESGDSYSWLRLSYTDEFLHKLDMQLGTNDLPFLSKAS